MTETIIDKVKDMDEYKILVSERSKMVKKLSLKMLGVYYAYILIIAFSPDLFAHKIGGGVTTVGIVVGLGVIAFSFLITGIAVHASNTKLEPLAEKLHAKISEGE